MVSVGTDKNAWYVVKEYTEEPFTEVVTEADGATITKKKRKRVYVLRAYYRHVKVNVISV